MDTYENEYTSKPVKESPYADSPYECACAPAVTAEPKEPKPVKPKKGGFKRVLVVVLLVACCVGTGLGVDAIWQKRMDRMEAAMNDKFAALEQLYSEKHTGGSNSQFVPPLTNPGQVYEKNVQAVVAVSARYETANGVNESSGSGFIISADGYVVTNYHVIDKATGVSITTHGGQSLKATVVGYDSANDIALLKVAGENMPFVTLGSSDKMAVGDQVVAIGNPLGDLTSTLTVGYISAKDRVLSTDGSVINMLQTDAAINAGNSGGPLFNMSGEVIGIITAKFSGNSSSGASIEGLGFAIPTDDVAGILSDLKQYGYVTGAYLGVYVRDVDASAQSYGIPAGAYIDETMKGYCAEKAGIRAGDIIVNVGGYDVNSVTSLTRALRRFKAGETTSMTVYRNGQNVYLTITFDEKPVVTEEQSSNESTQQNGSFNDWFDFFAPFFGMN